MSDNWREDLRTFLEVEHKDIFLTDEEDLEAFMKAIFDFMDRWMKKTFIAGHKYGTTSVYQQLPESIKDKYDYDPDIDKHWAEKGYQAWVRE